PCRLTPALQLTNLHQIRCDSLAFAPSHETSPAAQSAIDWLLSAQETDGSWFVASDEDGVVPTALAIQALQVNSSKP
ncbi:hypothetical protein, partial [Lampropedia puyangensis]|uniref:hypothetical protein n=1 Tax=Lampropedia puyangensis TaxID=1330072 RepID=UPI001B86A6B3